MHHLATFASAPAVVSCASVRRDRARPAKLASFASKRQRFSALKDTARSRSLTDFARPVQMSAKADDKDALDDVASGYADAGPSLSDIQALMDAAIKAEDFDEAARLRDRLKELRGNSNAGVLDCNERFYQAFRKSDMRAMRAVWGVGDHVQCLHPGSACISGDTQVMASWEIVFSSMPPGQGLDVNCEQVRVHATSDWGFITCVERVDSDSGVGTLAATNVFEVQDGEWKIIHHQAHGIQTMH